MSMLSRRHVLALGAAVACASSAAHAQPAATAPVRVIRAQPGASFAGASGDASASLWGYEGTVPGPVLRARRGEELRVRLINELSEPTSIHWHGVRVPNAMDGVPGLTQAPVEPGASFEYVFRATEAGTFWYHASSPAHVGRGLHGALIIDETETVDVDRDLVLLLGTPVETQAQAREARSRQRIAPTRYCGAGGGTRAAAADQCGGRARLFSQARRSRPMGGGNRRPRRGSLSPA